jgi:acylphosphatase
MSKPSEAPPVQRRRFRVQGTVQGVGFRPAVHAAATALGLSGWVANDDQGVIGEVEGPADLVDAFVAPAPGRTRRRWRWWRRSRYRRFRSSRRRRASPSG